MAIGNTLRQARLDLGLDLQEISQRTKIASRFLEAIEKDDRHSLPAGFFYKNWVLQYGEFLGLDTGKLAQDLQQIMDGDREPALPGQDALRLPESRRPVRLDLSAAASTPGDNRLWVSSFVLIAAVLACSGVYSWWRANPSFFTMATIERVAKALEAPPAAASQKAPEKVDRPAEPPHVEQAQAQTEPAPAPTTAPVPQEANSDLQIELTATERTWVSLAPDGKEAFSGVLQPAQVQSITAHENARIRVGNAGGINLRVNGRDTGPVGAPGQVRLLLVSREGVEFVEPRPVRQPSDDGATVGRPISQE